MNLQLFATLKNYNFKNLPRDIFSGIIIAAVSIPISMGYAQISGIPAIYGLYGSVFPILFFALFSTSKQFIFGGDRCGIPGCHEICSDDRAFCRSVASFVLFSAC